MMSRSLSIFSRSRRNAISQVRDHIRIFGHGSFQIPGTSIDLNFIVNGSTLDQLAVNELLQQKSFKLTFNEEESFDLATINARISFFSIINSDVQLLCSHSFVTQMTKIGHTPIILVFQITCLTSHIFGFDYLSSGIDRHDHSLGSTSPVPIEDEILPLDTAPPPLSTEQLKSYFTRQGLQLDIVELQQATFNISVLLVSDFLSLTTNTFEGDLPFGTIKTEARLFHKFVSAVNLYHRNKTRFHEQRSCNFDFDYLLLILGALLSDLHYTEELEEIQKGNHRHCSSLQHCPILEASPIRRDLPTDTRESPQAFIRSITFGPNPHTFRVGNIEVKIDVARIMRSHFSDTPNLYSKLKQVPRLFFNFVEAQISAFADIETQSQTLNHTDSPFLPHRDPQPAT